MQRKGLDLILLRAVPALLCAAELNCDSAVYDTW